MASAESEGQAKLLDVRYAVLLESLQERYHDNTEEALGFRHISSFAHADQRFKS